MHHEQGQHDSHPGHRVTYAQYLLIWIANLPEEQRKEVIYEAMHLARSPEAAGMPGYLGSG